MTRPRFLVTVVTFAIALASTDTANALPQFGRKYKIPCSGCHDAPAFPRLNEVGYKFRRAGYRMPETIGQAELADYTLDNYFGAAVIADNVTDVERANGSTDSLNTFAGELTLYALTGSFAKYFASSTEVGLEPGNGVEIENAYVRAVYGGQDLWVTARGGVFHPIEGFGGSDRSLGPSRPLIFEIAANQNQDTLLLVPELDRIGLDIGGQWKNTSLSVAIVNHTRLEVAEGEVNAIGVTADTRSGKDLIVFANQILGARSGLSAYWAHGRIGIPVDPDMFAAGTSEATFDDRYDKLAVFASGGTGTLLGLAGAQVGFDQAFDPASRTKSRFTSVGGYVEANLAITPYCVGYLRFDAVDPSTDTSGDRVLGGTLGALLYQSTISIVPELTLRRNTDETAVGLVLRARVIY